MSCRAREAHRPSLAELLGRILALCDDPPALPSQYSHDSTGSPVGVTVTAPVSTAVRSKKSFWAASRILCARLWLVPRTPANVAGSRPSKISTVSMPRALNSLSKTGPIPWTCRMGIAAVPPRVTPKSNVMGVPRLESASSLAM